MQDKLIGRSKEVDILIDALHSHEAEMVAVIGRRRVGKTFLIKSVYQERIIFEITGLQKGAKRDQLENFVNHLKLFTEVTLAVKTPTTWLEAFFMLVRVLEKKDLAEKKVIFLDELPWMATSKSGFLTGLGFFWNSWAVNKNVVIVICGSAASWMIKKVVNNTGGLYNRITKRIYLKPFNLVETEFYLKSRNIHFNRYQIVQLYMAMGGIPHYLKEIKGSKSAVQNIDDICFDHSGILQNEFSRLYTALFADAENHVSIIRALATKRLGLTRTDIVQLTKLPEGGSTTRALEELEQSGFISSYRAFGKKKKDKLYRLTDEYSLFYLRFIENSVLDGRGTWQHLSQTQAYKSWSGYTYESICLKHIPQIKRALSIAGVYATSSSFQKKGTATEQGIQIDLLIDRNDQVINIFEIKFYQSDFSINAVYAQNLRDKLSVFQESTKSRKQLMLTLITTFGLKHNMHSLGLIHQVLTLDDLFLD